MADNVLEDERRRERERGEAKRRARFDPAQEDVGAGFAKPENLEQVEEFGQLEPEAPKPFSRDGRDYYVNGAGKLVSVDAGFDVSADYPDYVPATAERVAERDLQKKHGGFTDRLRAAGESALRTVAGAESLASKIGTFNPASIVNPNLPEHWTAPLEPDQIAPGLYTRASAERAQANPWSALGGSVAADVATSLLMPGGGGAAGAAGRTLQAGLFGAGSDAALTLEEPSMGKVAFYGLTAHLLEGVSGYAWGEAMRALGKKSSALEGSVAGAQRAAIEDAAQELDPVAQAAKLRANAEPIYEEAQKRFDAALATIEEQSGKARERMFTPGRLKQSVKENLTAQVQATSDLGNRLMQAAQVSGHIGANEAAEVLASAGHSGPELYAALRQARQILLDVPEAAEVLGRQPRSALVDEAAQALEDTLGDQELWGRAAQHHAEVGALGEAPIGQLDVRDLGARDALDQRLAYEREVARVTGNKPLLKAIREAEQAVVDADKVTGANVFGPEPKPPAEPLTGRRRLIKGAITGAGHAAVGKVTGSIAGTIGGGLIGGPLGGILGAGVGTVVGDVLGNYASPLIERAGERIARIGQKHGGKIAAAGALGLGAYGLSQEDTGEFAAAGAGILALPILLRKGRGVPLGELLADYTKRYETALGKRDFLTWEQKRQIFDDMGVESHAAQDLISNARESLETRRLTLDAPAREVEDALRANYYFDNRLSLAHEMYKSEARRATRTANRSVKPSVVAARKLLGAVGENIEGPFNGIWERNNPSAFDRRFTYTGDTLAEVLKKRLKDKAPLSFDELADNVFDHMPGAGRGPYTGDEAPSQWLGREHNYKQNPEWEAWEQRAREFHAETARLEREKYGLLRARLDEATAKLPEGDKIGRTAAEDGALRSVLREALGMKAPKAREIPTNVDATSRYRKLKKGFDGWSSKALTEPQREALRYWQSHEYRSINALVREGDEAAVAEAERLAKMYRARFGPGMVKDLDAETAEIAQRAKDHAPELLDVMNHAIAQGYAVPGRVTRGISMPEEEMQRLLKAETVTSQGFMSTSIRSDVPQGFAERRAGEFKEVPVLLTIEQKTGVPIGQGEGEITLRPGTKFAVEWASPMNDGSVHAYLREVEPSQLSKADLLKGIAGSIPTEAKVAGGLLAVDAATSDEDDDPETRAAGVGALALLFGGARRMRGIQSRMAMAGRHVGEFTSVVDRVLAENEKTITSVARWGKEAERRPLQDAIKNLKRHLEGRVAEADAAIDAEAPYGRKYSDVREYLSAAVDRRLAQEAGSAIGQRTAAPRVEKLIEAQGKQLPPFHGHPLLELLPPNGSEQRRAHTHRLQKQLSASAEGDPSVRAIDYVVGTEDKRVRAWVGDWLREPGQFTVDDLRRSADEHQQLLAKSVAALKGAPADPWGLPGKAKAIAKGAALQPVPLTELEKAYLDARWAQAVGDEFQTRYENAEFAQSGKLPARGLEVRAALKHYTQDEDLSGAMENALRAPSYDFRSFAEKRAGAQAKLASGEMPSVGELVAHLGGDLEPDARRYFEKEVADRRKILVQNLRNYDLSVPVANAVVDDLIEAVSQGRPFAAAVDDIATTLDSSAAEVPLTQVEQQRAAKAFEAWEKSASEQAGFSIQRAIDDYAGDWDYKNINAYARGAGGPRSIASIVLNEIEIGNAPSYTQLERLINEASKHGDNEVAHWALKVHEHGDDESIQALFHALKEGSPDAGPQLADLAHEGITAQKANRLQHALDLAVSDGMTAPGVTYRGVLLSDADLARIEAASTTASAEVEAWGFMSSSSDPDYAARFISRKQQLRENPELQEVLFEVVQKTGVPMNTSEGEVLLRAGTRFRIELIDMPMAPERMSESTAKKVAYRLTELDHEPKLPTQLDAKSKLPWVAGGVLVIGAGAALEGDAAAAEEPTGQLTPEEQLRLDATREKLDYLQKQKQAITTTTARAMVNPEAQKARKVRAVPGVTQSAGVAQFLGSQASLRGAFEEKRAMLRRIAEDPMSLVDEMSSGLGDLADASPDLHGQAVGKTYEIVKFLADKLPGTVGQSLVRPEGTPPTETAIRQFALYYSAATNPSTVYTDLANNRARREQVETLQALWPEEQGDLVAALAAELSGGRRPSLAQRSRLSILGLDLGGALDRAFSPRLLAALNEHRASEQASPAGASMPDRRSQPSIKGASPLAGLQQGPTAAA